MDGWIRNRRKELMDELELNANNNAKTVVNADSLQKVLEHASILMKMSAEDYFIYPGKCYCFCSAYQSNS